jgi:carbamoyltransferase
MNILGINQGHNGAAAYVVDGELKFYIEEERLSRQKYDGNPFRGMLEAITSGGVDVLVIGGTSPQNPQLTWTGEDVFTGLVRKFNPNMRTINVGSQHHLGHAACAFYNSGFETAAAVIVDGAGSFHEYDLGSGEDGENKEKVGGFEVESIFKCGYPDKIEVVYRSYGGNPDTIKDLKDANVSMDTGISITKAYEAVSHYLGFGFIEAGKTMGLAPYGKENESIPELFVNNRGNKNVFIPSYPAGATVDHARFPSLEIKSDPTDWHRDASKVTEIAKDLAWKIQQDTQRLVGDLVQKAHDSTGETNIVIAGGYGLNCVANYYIQQRFPDLNIYFEPIAHDGGTAIGIAKLVHHDETKDATIRPLTSLYLGPEREEDYSIIDDDSIKSVEAADVAKLIADRNIVAMFQGRSEAGPRALGNRSILYDPTDPNGKDYVNSVKGREWFRPFAGTILEESFEEWFETHGLKEASYMMHAIDFKIEKHGEAPCITHVDGSCRIQTVNAKQNSNYYALIKEFEKIKSIPILFNTSFNLAGQPLVETLQDAIDTIDNSDIDYLYLPDKGILYTNKSNKSKS